MNPTIKVVVADDHPFLRKGIVATLNEEPDFEVVAEASDGTMAREKCKMLQPDILLLDLNMAGNFIETMRTVAEQSPNTKVVVLTAFENLNAVRSAIAEGVYGYLLKEEGLEIVVQALRTIITGGRWFSHNILQKLVQSPEDLSTLNVHSVLSKRERDLLKLVALGNSDAEIQDKMALGARTVRSTLTAIYHKVGVKTRVEAAVFATRVGMLDTEDDYRPTNKNVF